MDELTKAEKEQEAEVDDIIRRFTYHAPKGDQASRYETIRYHAKDLAMLFISACPNSRERSVALTHLETAVMWANASIARNK